MDVTELSGRPLTATRADQGFYVPRATETEAIETSIQAGINILLLSERGGGKTTLLRFLTRQFETQGWHAAYVEGHLAASPVELLGLIRARVSPTATVAPLSEQVGGVVGAFLTLNKEREVRRSVPGAVGDSQLLIEMIEGLRRDLSGDERRHIVLLDEVSSPEIVQTVFGRLRDEIWQLPIVWVVAGDLTDRQTFLRPPADAFFGRVIVLGPLDAKAAIRMLRNRVPRAQATDALLRAIVSQSTRTPRDLVRVAADVVLNGLSPEEVGSSRARRNSLLEALGEPSQRVVQELEANGPASASDKTFLAKLGFGRTRAVQLLRELEHLGIVEASEEIFPGGRPRKVYGLASDGNLSD